MTAAMTCRVSITNETEVVINKIFMFRDKNSCTFRCQPEQILFKLNK